MVIRLTWGGLPDQSSKVSVLSVMASSSKSLRYFAAHRTATWLELFFDLIFVVVVSKVTHVLAHLHHGHLEDGVWWKFPLMLLPVWWLWMLHTLWSNLYDADSKQHRVISLFAMLQMVVLSVVISTDWERVYGLFNVSYFGLRITMASMYFMDRRAHEGHAGFAVQRAMGMVLAALVSLSSVLVPEPWRYVVLYLGIGMDVLVPLWQRGKGTAPAIHGDHLVERMGLLIIILLGESVLSLSAGLQTVEWTRGTIFSALVGALLVGATWWIYFDSYHLLAEDEGKPCSGLVLIYPHFFTCLGLAVMANLIYHAIHPGIDRLSYQVMAMLGMLSFYLGKQIPYYAKFPSVRVNIWVNSLVTLSISGAALFLPNNRYILLGITMALMVYVALNYMTAVQKIRRGVLKKAS